jgi:hypothetical protein
MDAGQIYEPAQFASMTSINIGKKIKDYVNEVDALRKKSRNLKGTISHGMERCLAGVREASEILTNRAVASGSDTVFLGLRVKELEKSLATSAGEIVALKAEIADLRSKAAYEQDDDPIPSRGGRKTDPIEADEEYLPPVIRSILRGVSKELEKGRMVTRSTSSRLSFATKTEVTVPTMEPDARGPPVFSGGKLEAKSTPKSELLVNVLT